MTWAGIIGNTIIGPYFFQENVNGESYEELITDYVLPELHIQGFDSEEIIYMHDGAPAHRTRTVRETLDLNFHGWIGQGDGTTKILDWPPRSPDLNPLDFYLWGYLQHQVHLNDHDDTDELENSITNEIMRIPDDTLGRVRQNFAKRLRLCIQENGALFEHLMK